MKKLIIGIMALLAPVFYAVAADTPTYPGGEPALTKYISDNLKYPQAAKEMGVEGVVTVQFNVNTDGSIGTIKIVRMIDPDLEQEAIRLVKNMPAWVPADKNGSPIEAPAQVNIPFILNE